MFPTYCRKGWGWQRVHILTLWGWYVVFICCSDFSVVVIHSWTLVTVLMQAFATTVFKDDRTLHQVCSRGGATCGRAYLGIREFWVYPIFVQEPSLQSLPLRHWRNVSKALLRCKCFDFQLRSWAHYGYSCQVWISSPKSLIDCRQFQCLEFQTRVVFFLVLVHSSFMNDSSLLGLWGIASPLKGPPIRFPLRSTSWAACRRPVKTFNVNPHDVRCKLYGNEVYSDV